jgi:hypothetical protein
MPRERGGAHKNIVLSLVHRGGEARTFVIGGLASGDLLPIIRANIRRESFVFTDEGTWYKPLGGEFWSHSTINHSKDEYARGIVTTNRVEGYFSIFKRGMKGVYQHCAEKHLHRYLAEFDFRYSMRIALGWDDEQRADHALRGIVGKRLTYRGTDRASALDQEIPF